MSADLYLQDLGDAADAPLGAYQQWRKDPHDVIRLHLTAHGLDDPAAAPEQVRRDMYLLLDEAERQHDVAARTLDLDRAERVWIGQVPSDDNWQPQPRGTVERIKDLFWDAPILTRPLLAEAMAAFNVNNHRLYGRTHYVTAKDVEDMWWQTGMRRTRRGPYRMVSGSKHHVGKARPVRRWLADRLGHRLYPVTA